MTKKIQQNLLFMALILGGLGYVYFNYLMGPLNAKYSATVDNIRQTETKLMEMKRRAMELPKLKTEMAQLEQEVSDLEKLLPKDKEIPDLLRTVTRTAQKYELKVSNFAPAPIVAQENYNEVPFQMVVQGPYHSLARFYAELGQEPRILSTWNVNMAADPSTEAPAGGASAAQAVNAAFNLIAYTFKQ